MYAVLVAGVVSMSGILLANIIVKQLVLSSIGRESQSAYYAANAGAECAEYGEVNNFFGKFDSEDTLMEPALAWTDLQCIDIDESSGGPNPQGDLEYFLRVDPDSGASCADVHIVVRPGGALITSRGINFCNNPDHPRAVAKEIYRVSSGESS